MHTPQTMRITSPDYKGIVIINRKDFSREKGMVEVNALGVRIHPTGVAMNADEIKAAEATEKKLVEEYKKKQDSANKPANPGPTVDELRAAAQKKLELALKASADADNDVNKQQKLVDANPNNTSFKTRLDELVKIARDAEFNAEEAKLEVNSIK